MRRARRLIKCATPVCEGERAKNPPADVDGFVQGARDTIAEAEVKYAKPKRQSKI